MAQQQGGVQDVPSYIISFLRDRGLNDVAIAGVMGNLQTESGFRTDAYNAGEGAIGLAQWEGGRRTALQQYAASIGQSETSLDAQLGFLWRELTQRNLVGALNTAGSAGNAAAIFDGQFEVSAGTTRTQRINYANNWLGPVSSGNYAGYAAGIPSGPGGTGGVGSAAFTDGLNSIGAGAGMAITSLSAQQPGAGAGLPGGGGGMAPQSTAAGIVNPAAQQLTDQQKQNAYEQAIGLYGALFNSNPELKSKLDAAVAHNWTIDQFQQAIAGTQWYRTNSDKMRSIIAMQTSDPATWQREWDNEAGKAIEIGEQLGVKLDPTQAHNLAMQSLANGWSTTDLQDAIGAQWQPIADGAGGFTGDASKYIVQLNQLAQQYNTGWDTNYTRQAVANLVAGRTTMDTYTNDAIVAAKSKYPGLSSQIDAGLTVEQIASPYKQTMAGLLEMDPQSVGTNDPMITRALQNTGSMVGGKASDTSAGQVPSTPQPLWQFEQTVRQDPRWEFTNNANQSAASLLLQLGKDWGYAA